MYVVDGPVTLTARRDALALRSTAETAGGRGLETAHYGVLRPLQGQDCTGLWLRDFRLMSQSLHVPMAAVVGVTAIAAAFSALIRLSALEKGDDRAGVWGIFAIGPDLIVGAVVAIPSLLAGRNAILAQSHSDKMNPNWNINGMLVLAIFFLFCVCVSCERLWCKKARAATGWQGPLLKGIIPSSMCGLLDLGIALALGAS